MRGTRGGVPWQGIVSWAVGSQNVGVRGGQGGPAASTLPRHIPE